MPQWTTDQQKVIDIREQNMLVSAAAGSGKTAVLVERIIQRVLDEEHPIEIDRIVVVTFTKAAAAEMRERILAAIQDKLAEQPDNAYLMRQATLVHNAQITTIDSFCNYIVRNHFHEIDLEPDYRIGDEGEMKLIRKTVMDAMMQKQYEDAIDYYKEALDTGEVQENYLRDYMMALARSGQNVEQSVIEIEYPEAAYMERADVELIEAQTKYTQGEFEEALIKCEDALAQSTDIEVSSLICVLESEIYTEQEEYTKAADSAIRVTKFDSSKDARRRAGSLAFEAGNHLEDTKEKNGWYEKARKYYETLCQDETCSYEDEMNYALVLQALEQYSDSNVCLRKMREEYPDDYKVLMWMCYNYLGIGNQKGSMAEVESDLNFAYSSCKYLYSQDESMTGGSDEDMEKLNELMKQLEE